MHHVLTQYKLNAGLQWYKEQGTNRADTDLKQIHDKLNFSPINNSVLTQQHHADVLRKITFLKEKWCVKVKGCMCTAGRKHKKTTNKPDYTQTIVSTESV